MAMRKGRSEAAAWSDEVHRRESLQAAQSQGRNRRERWFIPDGAVVAWSVARVGLVRVDFAEESMHFVGVRLNRA